MGRKGALLPSIFRKGRESMKKKLSLCVAAALGAAVLFGGNAEAATAVNINKDSDTGADIHHYADIGIYNSTNTHTYTGDSISIKLAPPEANPDEISVNVRVDSASSNDEGAKSVLNLGNDKTKNIDLYIDAYNKLTSSQTAMGLWAYGAGRTTGNVINIAGDNLSIVGNTQAEIYALYAQNSTANPDLTDEQKATININTENTYINVKSEAEGGEANAIVAMSQGIVNINSNLEIHADNVIVARGDAKINVNTDGQHSTKLYGDVNFNYDKQTSGTGINAIINMNLTGPDSVWNGNTKYSWGTGAPADPNKLKVEDFTLTLADGAQWNPDAVVEDGEDGGDSGTRYTALNNLNLNGGIINITGKADQEDNIHTGLTIEKLSGTGGTVNLEAADDFTTRELSILSADGNGEKPTQLAVNFTGINADDIAKSEGSLEKLAGNLKFGTDSTGISEDDLTVTANVEEGLIRGELSADIITTGTESGTGSDNVPGHIVLKDVQQNSSTTTMENMKNIAAVSIAAWRQEDSTLSQRLGDLRETTGGQGIWARVSRGEFEYSGEFKNQYNYFQIGWDMAKNDWHYGAAVSYNDGETTYSDGNGENSSTSLSLYGTRLLNDGQYFDIVLKAGRLNNKYDNYAAAGHTHGDYDAWGTEISGEYGKKIDLANDWFVTPQAQLSLMRIGSEDYTTSNGIHVDQDTLYSAVGRIGAEAGKKTAWGSLYAKASVLHDFAGDADTYLTYRGLSNSYSQDIGDTWYEAGFGANWKMSSSSYLYVDVIRTFGGDIKTPWQWNAGVRWGF